jgi:hypothetical protein
MKGTRTTFRFDGEDIPPWFEMDAPRCLYLQEGQSFNDSVLQRLNQKFPQCRIIQSFCDGSFFIQHEDRSVDSFSVWVLRDIPQFAQLK